jgi:hypothetical protein
VFGSRSVHSLSLLEAFVFNILDRLITMVRRFTKLNLVTEGTGKI